MKEIKVRGRAIAIHLIISGEKLVREETNKYGNKVYVFELSEDKIEELKAYIKKQQKLKYY